MRLLIKNIQELLGVMDEPVPFKAGASMAETGRIRDAWILTEDGRIADYGSMEQFPAEVASSGSADVIDASGRLVFPAFCDSHTHMVFPATREIEYVDKIKGLSYEEIARRGGGILNSARRMAEVSEAMLFEEALPRLDLIRSYGTGAVEIKSGYGLTTETELKMLRVIKRLKESSPLTIRATFLGAHAFPQEYRNNRRAYVEKVADEMLPAVAAEGLADYVDVFCDKGFFSVEDTEYILEAAARYGLVPKIHANELDFSGGIQVGVKYGALSVDHLEYTGDAEIAVLLNSKTMPTLLPGAAFFLGMIDPPVRKMIDSGLPVAMASDFNPGSSPSGNMQLIWSMGCIKLRMLPEEAFNAITINSAYAMGLSHQMGTITRGKLANLVVTKPVPNIEYMPYAYGDNKVEMTIINGEKG